MLQHRKTDPLFPIHPINPVPTVILEAEPYAQIETVVELEALPAEPSTRRPMACKGTIDLTAPLADHPTVIDRYYSMGPAEAKRAMEQARDLDQLLLALALGAHALVDNVQIYLHQPGRSRLVGHLALTGGRLDTERVRERTIPLGIASLISRMVTRGLIFTGPTPDTGPSAQVLEPTGALHAEELALVPVILDQETFCLVLGHNDTSPLPPDVSQDLSALAMAAAAALARQNTALTLYRPSASRQRDTAPSAPPPVQSDGLKEPALRALVQQLGDRNPDIRASAALALWPYLGTQPLETVLDEVRRDLTDPDPRLRREAIGRLGVLHDPRSVSPLIASLVDPERSVAEAAHHALVETIRQDLGPQEQPWEKWWRDHGHHSRQEWLIEALAGPTLELRTAAAWELEQLSGSPLDYDPNAPRKQREAARRQLLEQFSFKRWWADNDL